MDKVLSDFWLLFAKGPSIKDVSPKGEGGGYPKKETLGDRVGTPFGAKETSFFAFKMRQKVSTKMGKKCTRFFDYKNHLEKQIENENDD